VSEGPRQVGPPEAVVLARSGGPSAVETLTELAHHHAARATRLEHDLAWLRGRLDADRVPVEAELAAVSAELDRLRALPELRVGQRLRHLARRGQGAGRTPGRDEPDPDMAPSTDPPPDPAAEGLGYPARTATRAIVVVRNRRAGLDRLLAWLGQAGVTRVELVDDASSDPLTRQWLAASGIPVHRVERELGPAAAWALGLVAGPDHVPPTLVVDGDTLPAEDCPDDLVDRLEHELCRDDSLDAVAPDVAEAPVEAAHAPAMWLVRAVSPPPHRMRTGRLARPYAVKCASWALADDDPNERFARLADAVETP